MEFQLSYFKSWKMMLWKCFTQYVSRFGKLSSGHRTGKDQFSFQSQRRAMPKNVQTTAQLHSTHMLARSVFPDVQVGFRKDRGSRDQIANIHSVQFSSVAQSCPTLCDPMNHSTPGLPVHHQLPEFTQTHVHRVGDAIQPSHPLSSPFAPSPSQHQGLFQWVKSSHEVAKVLEFQPQHQSFQWCVSYILTDLIFMNYELHTIITLFPF